MAKLSIPAVSPELRQAFEPIILQKYLDDDAKWEKTILPLFLERLKSIEAHIRQSVTSNANTPSTHTLDNVTQTISRIRTHLQEYFTTAAPFTIRRIAEMLLLYEESEYSLSTVALANKYLLSLARLVCVQSKETSFREVSLLSSQSDQERNGLSSVEYEKYGLPKDIEYSRLLWEDAPITETIMVKDKAELLEVVAEKGLSKTGSEGKQMEDSEGGEDASPNNDSKKEQESENSILNTTSASETRVSEEIMEGSQTNDTEGSATTQTKHDSKIRVQELVQREETKDDDSIDDAKAADEDPATKKAKLE